MSFRRMIAVAMIAALAIPAPALAAPAARKGKKEAARLARAAKKHYQRSEFLEAAQLFQKAYELSNVPSQLRNSAKSYEKAGALEKALEAWERYGRLKISRDEKLEAEAHVDLINEKKRKVNVESQVEAARMAAERAQLEARAAKDAAVEASRQPPPPAAPPPPALVLETTPEKHEPSIVPWFLVGGGAVIGIASAVLWGISQGDLGALNKRIAIRDGAGLIANGYTLGEAEADLDGINSKRTASTALLGTALAALLAGGIWLTIDYSLE